MIFPVLLEFVIYGLSIESGFISAVFTMPRSANGAFAVTIVSVAGLVFAALVVEVVALLSSNKSSPLTDVRFPRQQKNTNTIIVSFII